MRGCACREANPFAAATVFFGQGTDLLTVIECGLTYS
jgi:hypothetical protein